MNACLYKIPLLCQATTPTNRLRDIQQQVCVLCEFLSLQLCFQCVVLVGVNACCHILTVFTLDLLVPDLRGNRVLVCHVTYAIVVMWQLTMVLMLVLFVLRLNKYNFVVT